jgi:hypothetical protein
MNGFVIIILGLFALIAVVATGNTFVFVKNSKIYM